MAWDTLPALITKFAPVLHFDSGEVNLPSSTDWYVKQVGYQCNGGALLQPGWQWSQVLPNQDPGDYLVAPASVQATLMLGNMPSAVAYVHALPVRGSADELDLQYWIFYPYNGKETLRVDATFGFDDESPLDQSVHWGDWECVIVRVNSGNELVAVCFSQHSGGQWCYPGDGSLSLTNGTHPQVYVAKGSHANYPVAGGPYEIGAFNLGVARLIAVDHADGKYPTTLDLSAAGKSVLVSNQASPPLAAATASDVGWVPWIGRWGQPIDVPVSNEQVVDLLKAALKAMPWAAPLLPMLAALAAAPLAAAAFAVVWRDAIYMPAQIGPTNPPTKRLWLKAPAFLPYGNDQQLSWLAAPAMAKAPVATVSTTGADLTLFTALPRMAAYGWTGSAWKPYPAPPVQPDTMAAAIATPQGAIALVTVLDHRFSCMTSSTPGTQGSWTPVANWPPLSGLSGAGLGLALAQGQGQRTYFIAYAGTDAFLHVTTTTDWVDFAPDQVIRVAGIGQNPDQPMPVPMVTGPAMAPAVGSCGTAAVIVVLLPAQTQQEAVALASFVSTDGVTWNGPYLLPDGPPLANTAASLATGPDGTLYCFFCDTSQRVRFCSTSDGASWSDAGTVGNAKSQYSPTATANNQGMWCTHPGANSVSVWWSVAPFINN